MHRRLLWGALLAPALACSTEAESKQGRVLDSSAGTVELGIEAEGYRPAPVQSPAAIVGVVTNTTPPDTSAPRRAEAPTCADTTDAYRVSLPPGSLANALVWVEGIATGKPLPETRRSTLTIENCRWQPRISAVVAGSTINVLSRDRTGHNVRFYREGKGTPVATVTTMDAGQVVPSERIAGEPGIVEVRCEDHPWVRGWVAVFDHPYFAVTDSDGAFTMADLPPGTYTVKVWHERMERPAEQRLAVSAGGTGRVALEVALR